MKDSGILIIDDDPVASDLLCEILKPHHAEVMNVFDPGMAAELVKNNFFSLIISDVNMPDIPGHELIRILRCQGKLTPVIFVTGAVTMDLLFTAIRLGASDVLEKPFDAKNLLSSVSRVIEIDHRKTQLILDSADPSIPAEKIEKQKRMLGMLHVLNDKKSEKKHAS